VSGGSDYHADQSHGSPHPGSVSLPRDEFDRLKVRLKPETAETLKSDITTARSG
jgi:hypothetical protein